MELKECLGGTLHIFVMQLLYMCFTPTFRNVRACLIQIKTVSISPTLCSPRILNELMTFFIIYFFHTFISLGKENKITFFYKIFKQEHAPEIRRGRESLKIGKRELGHELTGFDREKRNLLLRCCLHDGPTLSGWDEKWDDFNVLKYITRPKRKFKSQASGPKCWLQDRIFLQDY